MEMEGLQDALEEAQYLCALNQGGRLEATNPLPEVSESELEDFLEKLNVRDPRAQTLTTICEEPLGFFMVSYQCLLFAVVVIYVLIYICLIV